MADRSRATTNCPFVWRFVGEPAGLFRMKSHLNWLGLRQDSARLGVCTVAMCLEESN